MYQFSTKYKLDLSYSAMLSSGTTPCYSMLGGDSVMKDWVVSRWNIRGEAMVSCFASALLWSLFSRPFAHFRVAWVDKLDLVRVET
jgi:hypothetical protein